MKFMQVLSFFLVGTIVAFSSSPSIATQVNQPTKSELDAWDIEALELEGVTKELQISKKQTKQFDEIASDAYSEIRDFGNRLEALEAKGATDKERLAFAEKEQMKPHERADARMLAALTPFQRRRLRQITFQFNGALLLAYPTEAKQMGLSERERKRIGSELDGYRRFEDRLQRQEWEASDRTWVVHADLRRLSAADRKEYDRLTEERLTAKGSRKDAVLNQIYDLEKKAGRKEITSKETHEQTIARLNLLAIHDWKAKMQRRQALSRQILARLTRAQREKWKAWMGRGFAFKTPTTLVG